MMKRLTIVLVPMLFIEIATAGIELVVAPTNVHIHVCEPVFFKVSVRNNSASDVQGYFLLSGVYHGFEIEIENTSDRTRYFFFNKVMHEVRELDIMFRPIRLGGGESLSQTYCLLYDVLSRRFVFNTSGQYKVHFRLLWDKETRQSVSASAIVNVSGWNENKEDERKSAEALSLWQDQEIAIAIQDNAKISSTGLKKLQELKEKYGNTVYGRLAGERLDRIKEMK
jgi:hypothetical protein